MILFHGENAAEQQQRYEKWLSELKPGDLVALSGWRWNGISLVEITRVTPTTIVIIHFASHIKVDRKTGSGKGEWRGRQIEPVTHKLIRTIKRTKLVSALSRLDTKKFSLDILQRINHLVQKEQKRIKANATKPND